MNIAVLWSVLPDELLYKLYHSNKYVLHLVSIVYLFTLSETKVSVNIFILLFYICPLSVRRGTPISFALQFFHEHRIQDFMFYNGWIFYIVSWIA